MSNQRYMMRGVSASKEDVHNAIKNIDKGIFPQAFCKIIPDILAVTRSIATLCMPMEQAPSPVLPICTGRKPATWVCGKALHKMH